MKTFCECVFVKLKSKTSRSFNQELLRSLFLSAALSSLVVKAMHLHRTGVGLIPVGRSYS